MPPVRMAIDNNLFIVRFWFKLFVRFELQEALLTRDQIDQDQNDGDDEKDVDKGTNGVTGDDTKEPQND